MTKITCPQCKRQLTPRTNKFGDQTYPYHMMATIYSPESTLEYRGQVGQPVNEYAAPVYEMPCPMSGQAVE